MSLRTDRPLSPQRERDDPEVLLAQREYLEAIQASVEASRTLLTAGPGERQRAHYGFMEATRRQASAERAYERLRQERAPGAFLGRPRLSRR